MIASVGDLIDIVDSSSHLFGVLEERLGVWWSLHGGEEVVGAVFEGVECLVDEKCPALEETRYDLQTCLGVVGGRVEKTSEVRGRWLGVGGRCGGGGGGGWR